MKATGPPVDRQVRARDSGEGVKEEDAPGFSRSTSDSRPKPKCMREARRECGQYGWGTTGVHGGLEMYPSSEMEKERT